MAAAISAEIVLAHRSVEAFAAQAAKLETGALIRVGIGRFAELLDQFLVAVDKAQTLLDGGLRVKTPSGVCSAVQKQNRGSSECLFMMLSF
jgi:hypothetical protein